MHLTFCPLQVFEAVARHRSFTRAAAELHLSQPGVSMQVKQLESVVGAPLLEHPAALAAQPRAAERGGKMC